MTVEVLDQVSISDHKRFNTPLLQVRLSYLHNLKKKTDVYLLPLNENSAKEYKITFVSF